MRRTVPWQQIIEGEVIAAGQFGAEYHVTQIGRVWVGNSDLDRAGTTGDNLLCSLVSVPCDDTEKQVWAIVNFQSSTENHS